jgi:HlyD family secretion protein
MNGVLCFLNSFISLQSHLVHFKEHFMAMTSDENLLEATGNVPLANRRSATSSVPVMSLPGSTWLKSRWLALLLKASFVGILVIGVIYASTQILLPRWKPVKNPNLVFGTSTRGPFEVNIIGTGTLKSTSNVTLSCEVKTREIKIVKLIPEGSIVKQGDVLCEFDHSEIQKAITEQKQVLTEAKAKYSEAKEKLGIQKNQNESDIAGSELNHTLATLDLRKYEEGEFIQLQKKHQGEIYLKEEELSKANESLEFTKRMVKKGYENQTDLESAYLSVKKSQLELDAKQEELRVLVDFDRPRKMAELTSKAAESKREFERVMSKTGIALEKAQAENDSRKLGLEAAEEELKFQYQQLELCVIKAPQEGEVIYANERAARWGDDYAIREGKSVYQSTQIIHLPDMNKMKVVAEVHESMYARLALNQTATMTVDAFPAEIYHGKITKISSVPAEGSFWDQSKKYTVDIEILDVQHPGVKLRPSLSCKFTILAKHLDDVLQVPVQAIVTIQNDSYCWVDHGENVTRHLVKLGDANDIHVEIQDGLNMGDRVVLNPRTSFAEEISKLTPVQVLASSATPAMSSVSSTMIASPATSASAPAATSLTTSTVMSTAPATTSTSGIAPSSNSTAANAHSSQ